MKQFAPAGIAISKALDEVIRQDRGRILSALIARIGNFQLAEDALQEASISALKHWGRSGLPDSPRAWLMKVALRKSIDRIRSDKREDKKADAIQVLTRDEPNEVEPEVIPDERLRLIFTCCHPALEEKSRVALTLRTICGLTTRDIAAAFLDNETTMGQRLSRAKSKISTKGISYKVPEEDQWSDRLDSVLKTLYLIFTTGYVSNDNTRDLCLEGIFLVKLLNDLCPEDPEIEGALALVLLTHARSKARINENGATVPTVDQQQVLWDQASIAEGQAILNTAILRKSPGPFQIKAAISDCHMGIDGPDWEQIFLLYKSLWNFEPTSVVALNWAVVFSELGQHEAALKRLSALEPELGKFQPWHAACASVFEKLDRLEEAKVSYKAAIDAAPTQADRRFLEAKFKAI